MSMHHMYAVPEGAGEGFGFPETGVIKGCEHHVRAGRQAWVLGKAVLVMLSYFSCPKAGLLLIT